MPRDYYETLGISRDASPEEVQRAFRTQARRFHPDVNRSPDAEERFKQINEAYQVLSDPESRERYDRFGPDFRRAPQDGSSRGGARGAGTRGTPFTDADLDLDELFGGLFGFGGRGRWPVPTRRPSLS
ncbi:DnaJ domain-containing protein [Phytohabitans houttuyneae]|uniref:J domain-containing protein n=1 Tax=Phytohabitans houttuyneae TaxID=1076126 RepID=A0A6V8KMM4_9ACTN|nr:DnaJ domain-containing protein [Phytohabitans houttuyneae]GFJ83778.1 hypothetical protein Phou_079580 [Phytohabitans houttuyneae]